MIRVEWNSEVAAYLNSVASALSRIRTLYLSGGERASEAYDLLNVHPYLKDQNRDPYEALDSARDRLLRNLQGGGVWDSSRQKLQHDIWSLVEAMERLSSREGLGSTRIELELSQEIVFLNKELLEKEVSNLKSLIEDVERLIAEVKKLD